MNQKLSPQLQNVWPARTIKTLPLKWTKRKAEFYELRPAWSTHLAPGQSSVVRPYLQTNKHRLGLQERYLEGKSPPIRSFRALQCKFLWKAGPWKAKKPDWKWPFGEEASIGPATKVYKLQHLLAEVDPSQWKDMVPPHGASFPGKMQYLWVRNGLHQSCIKSPGSDSLWTAPEWDAHKKLCWSLNCSRDARTLKMSGKTEHPARETAGT